jgi:hypothetical protein
MFDRRRGVNVLVIRITAVPIVCDGPPTHDRKGENGNQA